MKRIHLGFLLVSIGLGCSPQTSVSVAFNIANCEAHSVQIASLASIRSDIPKVILLNEIDSAVQPWIVERFGLASMENVSFRYLPVSRLNRSFSAMGSSTVFVLNGRDTISRFPIEELPRHIDAINGDPGKSGGPEPVPASRVTLEVRAIAQEGAPRLSSDLNVVANERSMWILDHFLGQLYHLDLKQDPVRIRSAGSPAHLFLEAVPAQRALHFPGDPDRMVIRAEKIVHLDERTGDPTLLMQCMDTTQVKDGIPAFHYALMTVNGHDLALESPVADIVPVEQDQLKSGLFPAIASSGYTHAHDSLLTQVFRTSDTGNDHPLFGYCAQREGTYELTRIAPYDYFTKKWSGLPAYNLVNGFFGGDAFVYSIAPVVVDLNTWREQDLSAELGLSIDSVMKMPQGYYSSLGIASGSSGTTLLCYLKDRLRLARFTRVNGNLKLQDLSPIDLKGFEFYYSVLTGRNTFVLTSPRNDKLLFGTYTP